MKKIKISVSLLLLLALLLPGCTEPAAVTTADTTEALAESTAEITETTAPATETTQPETDDPEEYKALNYDDVKALWISQFDMSSVYLFGGKQREEADFTSLLETILDNAVELGFNTVIYQVRPYADSMYPSEYYPPCSMVTGNHGTEHTYDVFEILVREAHERKLSVQAWINPMRAMEENQLAAVDDKYPIKQWYNNAALRGNYIVNVSGRWYLNIGYEEVRNLIRDGAAEILEKYDVDGLHMDDYFYPTTDPSFDRRSYTEYKVKGGTMSLPEYRKDVLSQLVKSLYDATKASGEDRIFGISPAGNYNTVVTSHYADVDLWCGTEGYIDYICPQIYFGMEHQTQAFDSTSERWQRIIKTDSVDLIIGMTLGKAKSGVDNYAGSGKNEWSQNKDILLRCLQYTKELEKCTGVAYFCYQYFYHPVTGVKDTSTLREVTNFLPLLKEITWQEQ